MDGDFGSRGLVHPLDDRRRPGQPGARLLDFVGRRLAGHAVERRHESAGAVLDSVVFASAGAGDHRRLCDDPDLHQPADAAADGHRRRLHRPGHDAHAQATGHRRRRGGPNQGRSHKKARGTGRGFPGRRSDGDRDRRRLDPPGRSQTRRRPARAHPARAAKRGRRHRHHHAQGPHPRQHAAGSESIPHQDRRRAGRRGQAASQHAAGHELRAMPPARYRASPRKNRPSTRRPPGSMPAAATRPRCWATPWSSRSACWPPT